MFNSYMIIITKLVLNKEIIEGKISKNIDIYDNDFFYRYETNGRCRH